MGDITNTIYDALISSESAPMTRVTDIDADLPGTANSHIPVECVTTTGAHTVFVSHDTLEVTVAWTAALSVANGIDSVVNDMNTILGAQKTAIDAFTEPFTPAEYQSVVNALQVNDMNPIKTG